MGQLKYTFVCRCMSAVFSELISIFPPACLCIILSVSLYLSVSLSVCVCLLLHHHHRNAKTLKVEK